MSRTDLFRLNCCSVLTTKSADPKSEWNTLLCTAVEWRFGTKPSRNWIILTSISFFNVFWHFELFKICMAGKPTLMRTDVLKCFVSDDLINWMKSQFAVYSAKIRLSQPSRLFLQSLRLALLFTELVFWIWKRKLYTWLNFRMICINMQVEFIQEKCKMMIVSCCIA